MQNATSALQIQQYTSACRAWMNSLSSWPGLWSTQFSLDDFELGGGNWRKVSFGYLNAWESVSHSVVFHSLEPHRVLASQDSLSLEFSRQEYRNGKPFPSPGDPPDPGIQPGTPALQADSLLSEPPAGSLGEC